MNPSVTGYKHKTDSADSYIYVGFDYSNYQVPICFINDFKRNKIITKHTNRIDTTYVE